MGKFVIEPRVDGKFQFNLKADNGQVILTSQGYGVMASCLNGVESVRANARSSEMFDKLRSTDGKFYFNLRATNGQVIGTSEMYERASGMDGGILSVMQNAPDAIVEVLAETTTTE